MKEFDLSICIPTFNRSKHLLVFLNKLAELDDGILNRIEVRIFDNNSTDNTQQIIEGFKNIFNVTHKKQDKNIGGTLNVIDIMQNCKGYYIWILGDDDQIKIEEFEDFFNQFIFKTKKRTWYFVGFETDNQISPFDFGSICSFYNKNNLKKTINKFGLNFSGFLGSHIFPSSSVDELKTIDDLKTNCWPHITLFLKSNDCYVFSDKSLSIKSGDLEWSSLAWYIALLSQILCYEKSNFTFSIKIWLMIKLVFSITYNKYLIYTHISSKFNLWQTNLEIIQLMKIANYKSTKTVLVFPLILNNILAFIPNEFLIKLFSIEPHSTKIISNEANIRKL